MTTILRGLTSESRAELIEFCEESAHYFRANDHVDFSQVSDEELLDYADKFEQMDYESKGHSKL